MKIEIKVDMKGLNETIEALSPAKFQKAIIRALDRTAKQGKVAAQKIIREEYNIKLHDISSKIKTDIHPSKLEAVITATDRSIPLIEFAARQIKTGVSFQVKRGSRKTIKSAFIASMKSGHRGVFTRIGKKRLPIKQLYTIGVAEMFGSKKVIEAIKKRIYEQWEKNITHEITEGWKHGKK